MVTKLTKSVDISVNVFSNWLNENHLLHDAVLFRLELLNSQNKGDISSPMNVLALGLKIPVDIASDKYKITTVVLRDVISMDVKIPQIIDEIYLIKAEIEVEKCSSVEKANSFRLKLFGERYLEQSQRWTECQIADMSFETFEIY